MFRLHRILRSLPFEPMALSTFETMERAIPSSSSSSSIENIITSSSSFSSTSSSNSNSNSNTPPYFISPKHDGVRIVSYVSEHDECMKSTCFSRFGRPVHGMFWIEEELQLLRWLCGDPRLVLDGELYIHKDHNAKAGSEKSLKTGFLAVAALVHRLRGPKSACSTEEEVLSYVAALPRFCIFDIVSFQPTDRINLSDENNNIRGLSQIEKERILLMREVMEENGIYDLEMLRVIPNFSVFSQRLKTMNFLISLLNRARASPIIFRETSSNLLNSNDSEKIKNKKIFIGVKNIGGEYVKLIQYSLLYSLEDAKRVYLKKYVSNGYEGAVVRNASNVYEVKEKEKGMLLGLINPILPDCERLLISDKVSNVSRQSIQRTNISSFIRTYTNKEFTNTTINNDSIPNLDEQEKQIEAEDLNHKEIANLVVQRAKQNSKRSTTVVKLLPFFDKEFAILKPLLKIPSSNPRTRKLVSIPLSSLQGGRDAISTPSTTPRGKNASKKNKSKTVVFYGLQCLSGTGRVFNVSLPKMDAAKQRSLLGHLLEVTGGSKRKGKNKNMRIRRRSLTGLYATVKYPSLTEYGIPRFGQVKAIRGGKGWFM